MSGSFSSPSRSRASSGSKSPLSLDLSDLPPLVQPSPPSNTLIITVRPESCHDLPSFIEAHKQLQNLYEPEIFNPSNLVQMRELINQHAPIHTWAPLKSFRRIVVSFFDVDSAISIRQTLDGETVMGCRIRVYFGMNTPLNPSDQHLPLPKSDKLFFISPPPSPPMGWEMHNESEPNKIVHAEDLAAALARLHARPNPECPSPTTEGGNPETGPIFGRRKRGDSIIVYDPQEHGDSPDLPAIAVEDTTQSPSCMTPNEDAMEGIEGPISQQKAQGMAVSTARPPVELMHG
jgi:hypothetical protein